MALPFFYINEYHSTQKELLLNEETSKHVVQVLRMKTGEQLHLTDGKGNLMTCSVMIDNKKHCTVEVKDSRHREQGTPLHHGSGGQARKVSIAISLIKNANRFEWFLEKATEIGVNEIIPLICERTENKKFRYDRMQQICISAMLQSQQVWLPVLHEPVKFGNVEMWKCGNGTNYMAHCMEGNNSMLSHSQISTLSHSLICIGPEGDFTPSEIELAIKNGFVPVSLGATRLRTETAGVVAAAILLAS